MKIQSYLLKEDWSSLGGHRKPQALPEVRLSQGGKGTFLDGGQSPCTLGAWGSPGVIKSSFPVLSELRILPNTSESVSYFVWIFPRIFKVVLEKHK